MKKGLLIGLCLLLLILLILPFVSGDLEQEELNPKTRADLGGSFVKLSDGYTHYEQKGDKGAKTIVLVHGNAAPYFSWDYNIDPLVQAGFRVVRYDIFGHGYSDRPDLELYNRSLYDRQLAELIEILDITDPVYLVGTSQGGSICAYFAAKHPQKVEKIALLSPLFDDFEGKGMAGLVRTKGIGEYLMRLIGDKNLTESHTSKVLYSDEKKEELSEKLKKQMHYVGRKRAVLANMRGNTLEDTTLYYKQVKQQNIPVLLTWADNDKSISRESMERLRRLIPRIQYHEIKGASHLAHYEFPEKINSLLIQFFTAVDRTTAKLQ